MLEQLMVSLHGHDRGSTHIVFSRKYGVLSQYGDENETVRQVLQQTGIEVAVSLKKLSIF